MTVFKNGFVQYREIEDSILKSYVYFISSQSESEESSFNGSEYGTSLETVRMKDGESIAVIWNR